MSRVKPKLQLGQTVYLKPINNATRGGNKEIKEAEICKVGRKYFEVKQKEHNWVTTKFHLDTYRQVTKYSPDYQLYFNKQQILDEQEMKQLLENIRMKVDNYGIPKLTLDQLRRINGIIEEDTNV